MSTKKALANNSHVDCFRAWGLAAGEHAFYAESLGQLYLFLTGAFLDHLGKDAIENALILNFHVGLNCEGEYDVTTPKGTEKKKFKISLTNPKQNGLVQRIASLHKKTGKYTLAVCSSAVLAEAFRHAKPEMKEFIARDYDKTISDDACLEVAIAKRLAELFTKLKSLKLRVFHTAGDLPLTALYLKFREPVIPRRPANGGKSRGGVSLNGGKRISELLATGLYEPRYATDVVQERSDVNLPVQILVAGEESADSGIRNQMKSLVEVYVKHINQHTTLPSSSDITLQPHTVNFFVVHYGEDSDLAKALQKQIETFARKKKLNCKCIVGVGPEMSSGGKSFHENFNELTHIVDYAIVLYPKDSITRHNVPYELGVFSQRFVTRDSSSKRNSSRATLVAEDKKVVRELSDWSGIPHIRRPDAGVKKGAKKCSVAAAAKKIFEDLKGKIPILRA